MLRWWSTASNASFTSAICPSGANSEPQASTARYLSSQVSTPPVPSSLARCLIGRLVGFCTFLVMLDASTALPTFHRWYIPRCQSRLPSATQMTPLRASSYVIGDRTVDFANPYLPLWILDLFPPPPLPPAPAPFVIHAGPSDRDSDVLSKSALCGVLRDTRRTCS